MARLLTLLIVLLLASACSVFLTPPTAVPTRPIPTPTPVPMQNIVVATEDIRAGTLIEASMLTTDEIPQGYVRSTMMTSVDEVIGKYARTNIFRDQIIVDEQLGNSSPFVPVVMAIHDIPLGVTINEDMVRVVDFPPEFLMQGALGNVEDVVGQFARIEISRGQLLLSRHVINSTENLARASDIVCIASQDIRVGEPIVAEIAFFTQRFIDMLEADGNMLVHTRCMGFGARAAKDIPQFTPIFESDIGN